MSCSTLSSQFSGELLYYILNKSFKFELICIGNFATPTTEDLQKLINNTNFAFMSQVYTEQQEAKDGALGNATGSRNHKEEASPQLQKLCPIRVILK